MSEIRKVRSEELKAVSGELKCGDKILLSGVVYTARDAAHKRFNALLDEGKELPIPLKTLLSTMPDLLLHLRESLSVHADRPLQEEWTGLLRGCLILDWAE